MPEAFESANKRGAESLSERFMRPIQNESVVERIIKRLTDALLAGELKPGQKIPTEMEICESMHVGRNSVREAIKALSAIGVVEIRRAEGTFICEGFSNRMLDPIIYSLILEGGSSDKIIELRRIFDIGIMEMVIRKANEADIKKIQREFKKLKSIVSAVDDEEALLDADIDFHMELESTLQNVIVNKLSVVVNRLTRPTRLLATREFLQKGAKDEIIDLHEGLLHIIENRDSAMVSEAIDEHFKYWKQAVG